MTKRSAVSYTSGTAALDILRQPAGLEGASIIEFPGTARSPHAGDTASEKAEGSSSGPGRVAESLKRVLESSEMYCSLRFESLLGCPYGLFTRQDIAILSVGATLIGVVSLALGA